MTAATFQNSERWESGLQGEQLFPEAPSYTQCAGTTRLCTRCLGRGVTGANV
eukprot:CAMPEP_0194382278 /NCGR_PEP_ID=MMETSP0174-20130528/59420_1 /TAXON_ID=216777 /ORGANISM="Proboscia alata, Strain PI-D3" /LENGTH=51 /DNA_ID=CAMNT_0039167463 /DNA_START=52 /DNA_END=203 /DNA_ORIENTATION=-